MDGFEEGANQIDLSSIDLESLFADDIEQESPTANEEEKAEGTTDTTSQEQQPVDQTKAFAKRLKESTEKAVKEEREAIAKSLGFDSYDSMIKSREEKLIKDKGLDPEDVAPVVDEIVKQRLNEDPRMKELENLRKKQVEEFGKRELSEITKLTNGEITKFSQLPKEVIDLWKQRGSLKSAYMEIEGEKLVNKIRGEQSKGTTEHLKSPEGNPLKQANKRLLNDQEKRMWKFFNPGISDEELNKKTIDI